MKIAVKKERTQPASLADNVPGASEKETSIDVPTSTVAKTSGLLTAILAAGLTASQLLSNVLGTVTTFRSNWGQVEQSQARMVLVHENFRIQLLQRVLDNTDPDARVQSLQLLLASGLLRDPNGKLTKLVDTAGYKAPRWTPRDLETLKDILPLLGGSAPTQANPQGQPGAGGGTRPQAPGGNTSNAGQTGAGTGTKPTPAPGGTPNPNPTPDTTNTSGNTSNQ